MSLFRYVWGLHKYLVFFIVNTFTSYHSSTKSSHSSFQFIRYRISLNLLRWRTIFSNSIINCFRREFLTMVLFLFRFLCNWRHQVLWIRKRIRQTKHILGVSSFSNFHGYHWLKKKRVPSVIIGNPSTFLSVRKIDSPYLLYKWNFILKDGVSIFITQTT